MLPGCLNPFIKKMIKRSLTQQEIAKQLGISPTAVSLTLSDPQTRRVSEERKHIILEFVKEHAPRLTPASTQQRVVLCLPEINAYSGSVYGAITTGIQEACRQRNWDLDIQMGLLPDNRELVRGAQKPSGIIAVVGRDAFNHLGDISKHTPVVLVNSQESEQSSDSVDLDNHSGMEVLLKTLYNQGHRRFLFLRDHNGKDRFRHHLRQRSEAFFGFALSRGLESSSADFINVGDQGPTGQAPAYDETLRMIRSRSQPATAIVCFNDLVAAQFIHAVQRAGLSVPDDFSVTGYDDHAVALQTAPRITTVKHDRTGMGGIAVDVLALRLERPKSPFVRILVPPQLVSRESHGRSAK